MLADLESLERRIQPLRKKAAVKEKEALIALPVMEKALAALQAGIPVRALRVGLSTEQARILDGLSLLTGKPVLFVCNVAEGDAADGNEHTRRVAEMAADQGAGMVVISAAIEAEIAQLPEGEQREFLATVGLSEPGLDRMIRAGYELLGLVTFFTVGPKEARAWTVSKGAKAPQAAGVIHTDFERGFIRAQTIAYADFIALGGETAAREAGKARDEGKEYEVQDGDVLLFKFNV
jgi:GTP-binding protein YchF